MSRASETCSASAYAFIFLLSDDYCSVRQKTQAKIALQSDSVARDERFDSSSFGYN